MKYIKQIKPFFVDDRGEMSHLISDNISITSVLYITSKKGSVRANHYHKKDVHYVYLLKGKIEYTYRDLKTKNSKKKTVIVDSGCIIHTPFKTEHAMRFLEDSAFLAFSIRPRNRVAYEKDTVRIKLV
jgi:dTDP-4-dehydrorhamnose 3,5-epimerase-like enzyme